jgi:hypothetical protein
MSQASVLSLDAIVENNKQQKRAGFCPLECIADSLIAASQYLVTSNRTPRTLQYPVGTCRSRLLVFVYSGIIELIKKARQPINCNAFTSY